MLKVLRLSSNSMIQLLLKIFSASMKEILEGTHVSSKVKIRKFPEKVFSVAAVNKRNSVHALVVTTINVFKSKLGKHWEEFKYTVSNENWNGHSYGSDWQRLTSFADQNQHVKLWRFWFFSEIVQFFLFFFRKYCKTRSSEKDKTSLLPLFDQTRLVNGIATQCSLYISRLF